MTLRTLLLLLATLLLACPPTAGDDDDATGDDDDSTMGDDDDATGDDDDATGDDDDSTTGDDDDWPDEVPTDQQAPNPWSGGGGTVTLDITGPGPWDNAPNASFTWSNEWGPDDSPGMRCLWGGTDFTVVSSFGYAFKGMGEGRVFRVQLSSFTGAATYTGIGPSDGTVEFVWEFADDGSGDDDDDDDSAAGGDVLVELSTSVSGSCDVVVDPLWWTGSLQCTGLGLATSEGATAGPIDLDANWACLGRPY